MSRFGSNIGSSRANLSSRPQTAQARSTRHHADDLETSILSSASTSTGPVQPGDITANSALNVESVFFNNILLLGFSPQRMEEKWGIPFNKYMFMNANQKGMEVVMHFLFQKLDHKRAGEVFKSCWPILDKTQSKNFFKCVFDWLQELERNGSIPPNNVIKSNVQSCHGKRFYNLLLLLSTHVLRCVMEREFPQYPVPMSPALQGSSSEHVLLAQNVVKLHIRNQTQKFIDHAQRTVQIQNEWKAFANKLSHLYKDCINQQASLNEEQRSLDAFIAGRSIFDENADLQRGRDIQRIREALERINANYEKFQSTRAIMHDVINDRMKKYHINAEDLGSDFNVEFPAVLVQQPDSNEKKLDLCLLIKKWSECLKILQTHIEQCDKVYRNNQNNGQQQQQQQIPLMSVIGDIKNLSALIARQVHTQHQYLNGVRQLSRQLNDLLLDISTSSIPTLSEEIWQHESRVQEFMAIEQQQQQPSGFSDKIATETPIVSKSVSKLQLAPPTPEYQPFNLDQVDPTSAFLDDAEFLQTPSRSIPLQEPKSGKTPAAAAQIARSIRQVVQEEHPISSKLFGITNPTSSTVGNDFMKHLDFSITNNIASEFVSLNQDKLLFASIESLPREFKDFNDAVLNPTKSRPSLTADNTAKPKPTRVTSTVRSNIITTTATATTINKPMHQKQDINNNAETSSSSSSSRRATISKESSGAPKNVRIDALSSASARNRKNQQAASADAAIPTAATTPTRSNTNGVASRRTSSRHVQRSMDQLADKMADQIIHGAAGDGNSDASYMNESINSLIYASEGFQPRRELARTPGDPFGKMRSVIPTNIEKETGTTTTSNNNNNNDDDSNDPLIAATTTIPTTMTTAATTMDASSTPLWLQQQHAQTTTAITPMLLSSPAGAGVNTTYTISSTPLFGDDDTATTTATAAAAAAATEIPEVVMREEEPIRPTALDFTDIEVNMEDEDKSNSNDRSIINSNNNNNNNDLKCLMETEGIRSSSSSSDSSTTNDERCRNTQNQNQNHNSIDDILLQDISTSKETRLLTDLSFGDFEEGTNVTLQAKAEEGPEG